MIWYFHRGLEPHLQRAHAGHTQGGTSNGLTPVRWPLTFGKNMRHFLICFACGAFISAIPSRAEEVISDTDAEVWTSVLTAKHDPKAGNTLIWHWIERGEVYDYGAMEGFASSMKALDSSLMKDFNIRNWDRRQRIHLETAFPQDLRVIYFDEEDMKKIFGKILDPGWWISPSQFSDCGSVVRFSLPGYSADKKRALVFTAIYKRDSQKQTYFILQKNGTDWKIIEEKTWWEN